MNVMIWGTRGSLASSGPETARYGGNTSCVVVQGEHGTILVLDAGTGLRRYGETIRPGQQRVDVLLTHLHLDHIQGLGFFAPLYDSDVEVHIWAPSSTTLSLRTRLLRYLSPPLFPVYLRDLPCKLWLHETPPDGERIGEFVVSSHPVCHPGATLGYRITEQEAVLAYIPDHEPALGVRAFPLSPDWTSGYAIAAGADLLIHDSQYTDEEYVRHVGWGHSSLQHAVRFAILAHVKHLLLFHHDPGHSDDELDRLREDVVAALNPPFPVTLACEGTVFELAPHQSATVKTY
jgi:phosphoribosyl 1,2-cyclic phosphodiesterase